MRKFVFKCLILIVTLFIGVLIGMNQANQGMINMKGYTDKSFQTPVTVTKSEDGQVNSTVLGNELPTFNLEERKEKLENVESFNFFAKIGQFLAGLVTTIAQSIVNFFASLF